MSGCAEERAAVGTTPNYFPLLLLTFNRCKAILQFDKKTHAEGTDVRFRRSDSVNTPRADTVSASGNLTRSVESRKLHKNCIKTSPQQTDPPRTSSSF
jgi:hypothetical protein